MKIEYLLSLILLIYLWIGCNSRTDFNRTDLIGLWNIDRITNDNSQNILPADGHMFLQFEPNGCVFVKTPCDSQSRKYSQRSNNIDIEELSGHMYRCSQDAWFSVLQFIRGNYLINEDKLSIHLETGHILHYTKSNVTVDPLIVCD